MVYVNDIRYANNMISEGYYATALGKGGLENTEEIYDRIFTFIKEKDCRIIGDAYEERLIDEVGSSQKEGQLTRVRIRIE